MRRNPFGIQLWDFRKAWGQFLAALGWGLLSAYVLSAEDKRPWQVHQLLVDPAEHNDWVAEYEVDLARSRGTAEPVLRLAKPGSLT